MKACAGSTALAGVCAAVCAALPMPGAAALVRQLQKAVSMSMLLTLAGMFILPALRNDPTGEQRARYTAAAIYRFQSDAMPRCEQFARHTAAGAIGPLAGRVLCRPRSPGLSV